MKWEMLKLKVNTMDAKGERRLQLGLSLKKKK